MKTLEVSVSTNAVGSECIDTIEVEDDATEAEMEAEALECRNDMLEWHWRVVP